MLCMPQAGSSLAAQCVACPAGTDYQPPPPDALELALTSAAPGFGCASCTAGRASKGGGVACTACARGTFAAAPGAVACTACLPGTVAPQPGALRCATCGQGSWAAPSGDRPCALCRPGYVSAAVGATNSSVCRACAAGRFADGARHTCRACVRGSHSLDVMTTCVVCDPREACMGGACATGYSGDMCSACQPGHFNLHGRCLTCPRNSGVMMAIALVLALLLATAMLKMGSAGRGSVNSPAPMLNVGISIVVTELQINLAFFEIDVKWCPCPKRSSTTMQSSVPPPLPPLPLRAAPPATSSTPPCAAGRRRCATRHAGPRP